MQKRTAIIATCLREVESIDTFLDAILTQTRQPDDIVIVDAGSNDGTIEKIEARIAAGAPIRLFIEPEANRSVGRNLAIEKAQAELIAVSDVGAVPERDWFEWIIALLEEDEEVGVVSGYYRAEPVTLWEQAVAAATILDVSEVDPETFLPSSRSVAFRKTLWEKAGKYPEEFNHNEDTPFDLALKETGAKFFFKPEAVVVWRPEASFRGLYRQFWRYARGDAQCGLWFKHYLKAFVMITFILIGLCLSPIYIQALWVVGFGFILYWLRYTRRAYKRSKKITVAFLAPVANLILDIAHVSGYIQGLCDGGTRSPLNRVRK